MELVLRQFIKALALLAAGIAMGLALLAPVLVKDLLAEKPARPLVSVRMNKH